VNSSQQTLISFFEATLGNENEARSAQPDNPADARKAAPPLYNPNTVNLHVLMVLSIGGIINATLLPPTVSI